MAVPLFKQLLLVLVQRAAYPDGFTTWAESTEDEVT